MRDTAKNPSLRDRIRTSVGYEIDTETWTYMPDILKADLAEAVTQFEVVKGEICRALDTLGEDASQSIDLISNDCNLISYLYCFPEVRDLDWTSDEAWDWEPPRPKKMEKPPITAFVEFNA